MRKEHDLDNLNRENARIVNENEQKFNVISHNVSNLEAQQLNYQNQILMLNEKKESGGVLSAERIAFFEKLINDRIKESEQETERKMSVVEQQQDEKIDDLNNMFVRKNDNLKRTEAIRYRNEKAKKIRESRREQQQQQQQQQEQNNIPEEEESISIESAEDTLQINREIEEIDKKLDILEKLKEDEVEEDAIRKNLEIEINTVQDPTPIDDSRNIEIENSIGDDDWKLFFRRCTTDVAFISEMEKKKLALTTNFLIVSDDVIHRSENLLMFIKTMTNRSLNPIKRVLKNMGEEYNEFLIKINRDATGENLDVRYMSHLKYLLSVYNSIYDTKLKCRMSREYTEESTLQQMFSNASNPTEFIITLLVNIEKIETNQPDKNNKILNEMTYRAIHLINTYHNQLMTSMSNIKTVLNFLSHKTLENDFIVHFEKTATWKRIKGWGLIENNQTRIRNISVNDLLSIYLELIETRGYCPPSTRKQIVRSFNSEIDFPYLLNATKKYDNITIQMFGRIITLIYIFKGISVDSNEDDILATTIKNFEMFFSFRTLSSEDVSNFKYIESYGQLQKKLKLLYENFLKSDIGSPQQIEAPYKKTREGRYVPKKNFLNAENFTDDEKDEDEKYDRDLVNDLNRNSYVNNTLKNTFISSDEDEDEEDVFVPTLSSNNVVDEEERNIFSSIKEISKTINPAEDLYYNYCLLLTKNS